mgnify:CR=1 FL=1|tara:strand:- start:677 stop:1447 length:771 start_codon:yes stop_codon:yes gene_type:complete
MKASVIIANYNNAKFIEDCIKSLYSQTYKNIEIIFFDDNSNDNSINIIEKFQDIKIIKNKIQTKYGSINQMNAFKKSVEISTGEIIFFLDSDDYFHENKIEKIINTFLKSQEKMIIYDYPIILKGKKEIIKKKTFNFLNTYWGYIHPTSCISVRKEFIEKVFNTTLKENFTDIWFDLRILIFSKYLHRYDTIDENLTYYRQTDENVSSKFKKFSKKWWSRRSEAHEYFIDFKKNNNLNINKNLDFFITKIINRFIQ